MLIQRQRLAFAVLDTGLFLPVWYALQQGRIQRVIRHGVSNSEIGIDARVLAMWV